MDEGNVVYGGVAQFDQYQAKAIDAIRDAFAVFLLTSDQDGRIESFSITPHPKTESQREWLLKFIEEIEMALEALKSSL